MRRNENPKHTHGCVLIEAPITHTFGPKEKMPLALGNEKKNFLGLETFIIPFNHFDVQSQAKATY